MVKALRNGLTLVLLTGLSVVSVAATVQALRTPLSAELQTQPRDLRSWLADRDLSQESPATRQRLARRLEASIRRGDDLAGPLAGLEGPERDQFQANLRVLLEVWFLDLVDRYHALPEIHRQEFLDDQIDTLANWVRRRQPRGQNLELNTPALLAGLGLLGSRLDELISQAPPEQQPRIRDFYSALQNRLIARQLEEATRD